MDDLSEQRVRNEYYDLGFEDGRGAVLAAAESQREALLGLRADMLVLLPRVRQALEGHRVDERSWSEYVATDVLPMLDRYIAALKEQPRCPHGNGLSCRECQYEAEAEDATWD